ncbi:nondiscriminating aspartyl-tRNA synthetase [Actinoplanes lutulentus]|uniref:Aspartate--tRNA(Asp/Asn) ligase n=1 Tax=Actinoplanes lutulentus TaxID=1287878 RepID=A0A327ZH04_9ACTN|nr:aspartate--tRNA(Asn) ligase [Actinoplanes lutulentus]MBB2941759.1 nondiscriminating aspartyl-tRNA synthetase [Actinoplanes lutulentus]RAK39679.1 aspartyl-tRNA synthetase [Actinoplanes lutulentus]
MQRILSTELAAHEGEKVTIAGWVHRVRQLKKVAFLIVRDAAGFSQVIMTEAPEQLTEGSVVEVTATVTANEQAPGGVELTGPEIAILSRVDVPLPFELHRPALSAGLPAQLDHAALALRHPARARNLRIAAAATAGFRKALEAQRFIEIQTPKIVESATESGANVFKLDYFGRPGYLAQSPQFYKQLMVGVFERVFEVGPVFRAEPSDTARHLAQYTSLDAEMGFITDHRDVMAALRDTLAGMFEEITTRTGFVPPPVPAEIPAVHFAEALRIAGAPADEPDLAPAHERALGEWALREHGSEFVYVTGYPMRKRPFYTHPSADPRYSNGFDLLFRGLEIVTGGQRLHRYDDYVKALEGESLEPYRGYLDGFRYGMPPHGGWAIGLERLVARLVGAANVREVTAFPRDLQRLAP